MLDIKLNILHSMKTLINSSEEYLNGISGMALFQQFQKKRSSADTDSYFIRRNFDYIVNLIFSKIT